MLRKQIRSEYGKNSLLVKVKLAEKDAETCVLYHFLALFGHF